MSKRQLPADRRSRIWQGFAASLLLTPLFFSGFFGLQISSKGGGASLYRGGSCRPLLGRQAPVAGDLSPKQRATGSLAAGPACSPPLPAILQIPPCRPLNGRPGDFFAIFLNRM